MNKGSVVHCARAYRWAMYKMRTRRRAACSQIINVIIMYEVGRSIPTYAANEFNVKII